HPAREPAGARRVALGERGARHVLQRRRARLRRDRPVLAARDRLLRAAGAGEVEDRPDPAQRRVRRRSRHRVHRRPRRRRALRARNERVIPDGRTPVVVVTGFLGSGKTTLVNQLVRKESDSLVIVNEFGEVPVDHALIESSVEKAIALPNGCLCCHLRGDLEETLIGAAMRRRRGEIAGFDRVIVETSGLADPGPVAQTLYADQALARDFKLGPIVTVVDASDAGSRKVSGEIARAQIAAADVVVLSKVDRAADASDAESEVRDLNAGVTCIRANYG